MRINITLDDDLVAEALALTGARTTKEVVHLALRKLIRSRRKKKNLADLSGRIRFRKNYDHKTARKVRG